MATQTPAVVMDKYVEQTSFKEMSRYNAKISISSPAVRGTQNWVGCALNISLRPMLLILGTGFAGNDSPSFVFPTAIATKGAGGGGGGSGSGRPAVANKPSFLTGGAGPGGHLSGKRGTEDLDFFIGEEALTASGGPGATQFWKIKAGRRS